MLISVIVDLIDLITCNIVRESGEEIVREGFVEVRRIVRKCWRTSCGDDPVMNAYD